MIYQGKVLCIERIELFFALPLNLVYYAFVLLTATIHLQSVAVVGTAPHYHQRRKLWRGRNWDNALHHHRQQEEVQPPQLLEALSTIHKKVMWCLSRTNAPRRNSIRVQFVCLVVIFDFLLASIEKKLIYW